MCAAIRRENYPVEKAGRTIQPAHTITLVSPLSIVNLLPHDVHFMVHSSSILRKQGIVKPGSQAPICEVDAESPLELTFHMDNFPGPGVLVIPAQPTASFKQRLRLHDHASRRLFLHAEVKVAKGVALKVMKLRSLLDAFLEFLQVCWQSWNTWKSRLYVFQRERGKIRISE